MTDADRVRFLQGVGPALRQTGRLGATRRMSIDAFAQRYAAAHDLSYAPAGQTPPATWFLETIVPERSHSFLRGRLGGGVEGELFYAERVLDVKRGQLVQGWTVALYRVLDTAALAYGIACLFKAPSSAWGGRVALPTTTPRGLTELALGDPAFDERYRIAVTADEREAVDRIFTPEFTAWVTGLPWERHGSDVTRFELRNGTLCVHAKGRATSTGALDAFCARAAHIAAQVNSAANPV